MCEARRNPVSVFYGKEVSRASDRELQNLQGDVQGNKGEDGNV